jgi:hypothetical protein
MTGPAQHGTVADVRAYWQVWAAEHGFVGEHGLREPGELSFTGEAVTAYVDDSRWVAECLNCRAGMAAWPDHDEACCLDCGHVYRVRFPHPRVRRQLEELLNARPDPSTRWWHPDVLELADVKAANAVNGDRFVTA